MRFSIAVAAILLAFTACNQKKEAPEVKPEPLLSAFDTVTTTKDVTIGSPTFNAGDTTGDVNEFKDEAGKKIKEINDNELVKMLPASIPGTETVAPDIGSIADGGKMYVVVSKSYQYPKGSITIDITDYKSKGRIPPEIRSSVKTAPRMERAVLTEKVEQKDYFGFNFYNTNMKSGDIRVLVAYRFYVRITYNNVPMEWRDVAKVVDMLKIGSMRKYN